MARDELNKALHPGQNGRLAGLARPSLFGAVVSLLSLLASGLMLWLVFANNPLGGEPHVILTLQPPVPAEELRSASQTLEIRKSIRPEDVVDPPQDVQAAQNFPPGEPAGQDLEPEETDTRETDVAARFIDKKLLPGLPQKALMEKARDGLLPRIGPGGRKPYKVYARKMDARSAPQGSQVRVALLVTGLGLNTASTRDAIDRLPGAVTLGFAPYAKGLNNWRRRARQNGHEVMLQLPMEPFDYPDNDPGPYTLLTRASMHDNVRRLKWLMGRFTGYVGVTNYMGAKFTASADSLRPILHELNNRGLIYVEDGASARSRAQLVSRQVGVGFASGNVVIDAEQSKASIDANLRRLETIALEKGSAIGVGSGLPITIKRIAEWAETLKRKGIVLVPVSATIQRSSKQAKR